MIMFEGLEHHDVERLGKVCGMRNQTEYDDLIVFAVL
jgi:hypothetical protein